MLPSGAHFTGNRKVRCGLLALAIPIILLIPSVSHVNAQASDPVLSQLRVLFMESVEQEGAIDRAVALLAEQPAPRPPIIEAYDALFEIMRANHAFWPGKKMQHLNAGLPTLDRLTERHPDHAEIRYLRLMSCYYLPRMLGRGWSVEEDFRALARLLPDASRDFPPAMYRGMVDFVSAWEHLTEAERLGLQRALAQQESGRPPSPAAGGF